MKTATAKELRQKAGILLEQVRRGQEVIITYRGRSVAALVPLDKIDRKDLNAVGFGMWHDRRDMRSVERWVKKLRAPRYRR